MSWRTKNETSETLSTGAPQQVVHYSEVTAVPIQSAKLTNKFYLYLCGKCGQEVKVTDNFCSCCGSRLGWSNGDE